MTAIWLPLAAISVTAIACLILRNHEYRQRVFFSERDDLSPTKEDCHV